jgi:hypothetical protein
VEKRDQELTAELPVAGVGVDRSPVSSLGGGRCGSSSGELATRLGQCVTA